MPLSLVGTFGVMYLLGYSLNNLTLMALTISTGFVVDDAIVMIENITRYIEEGKKPMDAALKGSAQIGFTIISLTISLIAVLIPLLFMGDIVGRLFREFAVTLSVTILVSAVVSLTLTPMMCARLLKHTPESEQGRLFKASERAFESVIAFYGKTLKFVLRFQTITLLVAVATLLLTVFLYYEIPKGFFPIQDTGVIQGVSEAAQSISFGEMSRLQQELAKTLLKDPAVESLSSFIGIDGTNTTLNSGRIQINLKPLSQRNISATRRDSAPATGPGEDLRHHAVHAAGAGSDRRRSREPHPVSVHARRSERGRAEHLRAENAGQAAATAGAERCRERSANAGPSGEAGVRSRNRFAAGHHAVDDRPDALRRLRPAPGVDHVHAVEPVSRGAGSAAGLRSKAAQPARPLHPLRDGGRRGIGTGVRGIVGNHVFGPSSSSALPPARA